MSGRAVSLACFAVALAASSVACGRDRYIDGTYHVTKVEDRTLCLERVEGDGERRLCDQFPRVAASRPLRVGDCVMLRLLPESSGESRLILTPEAACR